jgi:hypothetical protein
MQEPVHQASGRAEFGGNESMKRVAILVLALMAPVLVLSGLPFETAAAQSSPVANLRLLDDAGTEVPLVPAGPGEQIYRLSEGVQALNMAFDFIGNSETNVQVRVLMAPGTYIFQEDNAFDAPGSHTVVFDNRTPLAVGEYVVNIYVGEEAYLADSFQLVIGDEVTIPTPEGAMPEVEGTDAPTPDQGIDTPNVDPVDPPQGNSGLLLLAGVGIFALLGIVLWAAWSAMRRS